MKIALKIGFNATVEYWQVTLLQSKKILLTFILLALVESFLLHEISLLFSSFGFTKNYYSASSIVDINLLSISDTSLSLSNYLLELSQDFFYEFIIFNSFILGVYYHNIGFSKDNNSTTITADDVLDVPIENRQPTISQALKYISQDVRVYYIKLVVLLIAIHLLGGIIGNLLYSVFNVFGYIWYWSMRMIPYLLLLLLYLKWLNIPLQKFWEIKEKWLLIFVFAILIPVLGGYIVSMISAVVTSFSYFLSSIIEISNLLLFATTIIYVSLLIPFISIFYSQTLTYLKNETEA